MSKRSAEDLDRTLLGFVHTLKALGVNVDQHRIQTAYRAVVALGGVSRREHLYWACKFAFCSRKEDVASYDRAFDAWFGGLLANRHEMNAGRQERPVVVPGDRRDSNEAEVESGDAKKVATASELEILRTADFALLTPGARAEVEDWIAQLRPMGRTRHTRRFENGGGEVIDRRKTVRAALRAGGEVSDIYLRDRRRTPRKILFLIDISGSMRAYANAYLRFAYATKKARKSTEVFTIGTRLTRVTRALSQPNAERAIKQALREIPDWSGGTRLGTQLRAFIREHGARGSARGAIVVIASDGWERGEVQALGDGIAHLSRLAKRIIWVNPHLHRPGFSPLTAGMEIALPYVDRLVSGHSFNSFKDLCQEIAEDDRTSR